MQAIQTEIRVCVDVGCKRHAVAIGLSTGEHLESFEICHQKSGFDECFKRISSHEKRLGCQVSIAMEGYNGYARPLDRLVLEKRYALYNMNNLKFARFKEIFPGPAKTDAIDALKGLELFQLQDSLPMAKGILQRVPEISESNLELKRYTRRRKRLVSERVALLNVVQSDIQSVCPSLLAITPDINNTWFISFLSCTDDFRKLARKQLSSLLKIRGIGKKYADIIRSWQKEVYFSSEVDLVGAMILEDVHRIVELNELIAKLEDKIEQLNKTSRDGSLLGSIPGFGLVSCGTLAGEIGTIHRFPQESSLALYLGMAALSNSSGSYQGSKTPRQVNTRAKSAMMTAADRHRKSVPESQAYYEKKRSEGKTHNQAIRALGRQLCRVIFKMLKDEKTYQIKSIEASKVSE